MATRKFKITIEGKVFEAEVEEVGGAPSAAPKQSAPPPAQSAAPSPAPAASGNSIVAPMPGKVIKVVVQKGQQITTGDTVVILEAMKMEQEIKATAGGTVSDIPVAAGQTVTKNQPLIVLG